ncbi:carbohydrate sulfotransferase 14-like [Glandiceps talaboti]
MQVIPNRILKPASTQPHRRDRVVKPDDSQFSHIDVVTPCAGSMVTRTFSDSTNSDVHGARVQLLRNQCNRYQLTKKPQYGRLLVDPVHRVMYCRVAKVASSNWMRTFLILAGEYVPNDTIKWENFYKLEDHYKYLSQYKVEDRSQLLRDYTKFLFVRHPLTRLLSGYRNKISENNDKTYVTPMVAKIQAVTGSNSTFPQFHDFLQYLIKRDEDPQTWNMHFRPISDLCSPCEVKYDFIGHMETMDSDTKTMLNKIDENFKFPYPDKSITNSSATDNIRKYYKAVTKEQIDAIYKIYEKDFELFGYTTDIVL